MPLARELFEVFVAIIPPLIAVALLTIRSRRSGVWFIKVVGTSAVSILALGLLLMRLTNECASEVVPCAPPTIPFERVPGIFRSCSICISEGSSAMLQILNKWTLDIQAVSTAICVLVSSFTIMNFMIWAKRTLRNHRQGE
jgi:hypothetical protein